MTDAIKKKCQITPRNEEGILPESSFPFFVEEPLRADESSCRLRFAYAAALSFCSCMAFFEGVEGNGSRLEGGI